MQTLSSDFQAHDVLVDLVDVPHRDASDQSAQEVTTTEYSEAAPVNKAYYHKCDRCDSHSILNCAYLAFSTRKSQSKAASLEGRTWPKSSGLFVS